MTWRMHGVRVIRHGFWIAIAVGGQLLVRMLAPPALLRGAGTFAGDFLQTFSSIYGVIVAFAIYVVWQEHNETQITIEREATALADLFRVLGFFTSWPARDQTRKQLLEYGQVVPRVNNSGARVPGTHAERDLFDRAFSAFLDYEPAGAHQQQLYASALDMFQEVNQAREHRDTVAALRLPKALRWFVFIGGAISVGAMWLLWLDSQLAHAAFTAAMTWVIVAASSIVLDLDNPYSGDFVVNWYRFHEVTARMETLYCPTGRDLDELP